LVDQQAQTIEHLQKFVNDLLLKLGHKDLPDEDLVEKFRELEYVNAEMEQCVMVLEEENRFLRDQIASLLELDREKGK